MPARSHLPSFLFRVLPHPLRRTPRPPQEGGRRTETIAHDWPPPTLGGNSTSWRRGTTSWTRRPRLLVAGRQLPTRMPPLAVTGRRLGTRRPRLVVAGPRLGCGDHGSSLRDHGLDAETTDRRSGKTSWIRRPRPVVARRRFVMAMRRLVGSRHRLVFYGRRPVVSGARPGYRGGAPLYREHGSLHRDSASLRRHDVLPRPYSESWSRGNGLDAGTTARGAGITPRRTGRTTRISVRRLVSPG